MAFRSEAQRRFLFSREPEVAKEFAKETPKGRKLPERIKPGRKKTMERRLRK